MTEINSKANLNVTILCGGNSAEASVSRNSAKQIEAALRELGHTTHLVELDANCPAHLIRQPCDVVFPALHGPPGEDGTVQGMLESFGLAYVGSGVRGSALAMDKAVAKGIFRRHGLPVSDDYWVSTDIPIATSVDAIQAQLGTRLAVKPLGQGSAIGVHLLPDGDQGETNLSAALTASLAFGDCLVEPFITGREMTVGVLELNTIRQAFPVIEIATPQSAWYDFEHRYTPGLSEHIIPAEVPSTVAEELARIATQAHVALGLRDLSRSDFIVTADNNIYLLETNSLPGMTPTSLYPDGAKALGIEFDDLVNRLVWQAYRRHHMG